ncbi:hypothetical protein SERLADRAFT_431796 [Serpula lacrymans var. lacrymans S7.9]|uniref:DUF6589 domain-containing protein n=1 Tax=Serpula lacrymans var. lacrymans (strain S7.9) TaxID=578457 RepID=F8NDF5_SERL9|nr:uncharacterized protein SERLADRAFT_431796 [Serpula lacrymans var. lacrymans S7.9]EGO30293.1 hypothetical protein SERLADRAFT_431796 [Serpula lacrymans var. lacrymans S7.9]
MNIKQSTVDGNVEVLESLLRQGGISDKNDKDFDEDHDIDMSEYILLIHGDLLTKEQVDSVRDMRRIEEIPKNRFQYIIFVPGLFHYKMACDKNSLSYASLSRHFKLKTFWMWS